jgi:hypothetical protein
MYYFVLHDVESFIAGKLVKLKMRLPVGGVLLSFPANSNKAMKANQNLANGCQSKMNNDHCEKPKMSHQMTIPATNDFI